MSSSSTSSSLIDDAFALLQDATKLEEEGKEGKEDNNKVEAGTKYYEATYLMKRYLQRLPPMSTKEEEATRILLQDKIQHYESIASNLLMSSNSNIRSISLDSLTIENDDDNNSEQQQPASAVNGMRSLSLDTTTNTNSQHSTTSQQHFVSPQSPRFDDNNHHTNYERILEKAGQANSSLQRALDLDEESSDGTNNNTTTDKVINEYMIACQLYLDALQIAEEKKCKSRRNDDEDEESIVSSLKGRLTGALDRIEELKKRKNTQLMPTTTTGKKPDQQQQITRQRGAATVLPKANNKLTQTEIDVLKRSSLIASGLFLPWSDNDAYDLVIESNMFNKGVFNNNKDKEDKRYTDPDGFLKLSSKQKEHLYKWARPNEILHIRQQYQRQTQQDNSSKNNNNISMIKLITPYTIRQQAVQDCSFIASLCICSAYERRFPQTHSGLITSMIYPKDSNGKPVYNPYGKYIVKLWLNGIERSIVIDDYLPIDKYGNLLCSHTKKSTSKLLLQGGSKQKSSKTSDTSLELWVSIIEKAYMKMAAGSYDFPGSNSGVDLYSLTGWIPERIFFPEDPNKVRDFETPSDRAWERLYSANSFGDCLITVSMSTDISDTIAKDIGLVTGHAYAVLNVIQTTTSKVKLLQLKNPWAHMGWKGKYSCHDKESWSDKVLCNEVGYNPQEACKYDDGVFWISWDDILVYFRNLHLSWNPSLFSYRITTHALWPKDQGPYDDTFNQGDNPQYLLSLSDKALQKKATIWILLSRHVSKQEQEGGAKNKEDDDGDDSDDYLTVHVHRNNEKKERIWYPGGKSCVLTGAYTNNPHVLARYEVSDSSKDKYLSLVLSQYKKSHDLGYTLSCYCTDSFNLGQPVKELPNSIELTSDWTTATAGGPPGTTSFCNNPMWAVKIPEVSSNKSEKTYIQLRVSTTKTFATNVMFVRVDRYGNRPKHIPNEPPIDSGSYKHGFVATETQSIEPGIYTMIVSTFYPNQLGSFRIRINSTTKLKFDKI